MCRTGCLTRDHKSWGECARASNLQFGPPDRETRQAWDAELAAYASARRQGVQPAGTRMAQVERAMVEADQEMA